MTQGPFFTTLKNRGLIKISGQGRYEFLQNIITNDIKILNETDVLYACLLTQQGKFLHDFFITKQEEGSLHVECEGDERTIDLEKRLKKLKQDNDDIEIEAFPDIPVFAVFGLAFGYKDPRHDKLGFRAYSRPAGIPEQPFEEWDYLRISLGVLDGSRDMIVSRTTMDTARIARFNGLSHEKGSYIGQEPTANRHYCGLGKKHLLRVKLDELPEDAELRSSCRDLGIALMCHELAKASTSDRTQRTA